MVVDHGSALDVGNQLPGEVGLVSKVLNFTPKNSVSGIPVPKKDPESPLFTEVLGAAKKRDQKKST